MGIQLGRTEQVFNVFVQKNPVLDVQSEVPHLQSMLLLRRNPWFAWHEVGGRGEHVLEVATQYIPVAEVQSDKPVKPVSSRHQVIPPLGVFVCVNVFRSLSRANIAGPYL